jgi:hypothetical protein
MSTADIPANFDIGNQPLRQGKDRAQTMNWGTCGNKTRTSRMKIGKKSKKIKNRARAVMRETVARKEKEGLIHERQACVYSYNNCEEDNKIQPTRRN